MTEPSPLEKLLSHRLRGFGSSEHTVSALRAACGSAARFLEVDVRASQDGEMFLWHDAHTGRLAEINLAFANTPARQLAHVRYPNGDAILSLREALQIFSAQAGERQILCIDIKDYGFEERILQMVREAQLERQVCFISWIPQTLLRLHELGTAAPLVLSCCNVLDLGPVGTIMDSLLANARLRLGWIVALGHNKAVAELGSLTRGFQHGLVCRRIPESLLPALTSTRGGICVHRRLAGPRLIEYCQTTRLQLWVFSAATTEEYLEDARPGIDVVFCDDAPTVIRDLQQV
jgi:glycerophosphoryl diester phosphodiesterase